MAHYSKITSKAPVQVQNNNGFDKSFENLFTGKVGTLIPIVSDPVMPGTTINYGFSAEVQLPPMATDFYGKIDYKVECFFVPCRILYGSFQDFVTYDDSREQAVSSSGGGAVGSPFYSNNCLPYLKIPTGKANPGSLADYLGVKAHFEQQNINADYSVLNPLKFIAYHKIYNDWYLDSRIQIPLFRRPLKSGGSTSMNFADYIPWTSYPFVNSVSSALPTKFLDGSYLYDLRQRNWPKDYFTNASLKPQSGNDVALTFSTESTTGDDGSITGTGSFTIRGLRAANSLQLWRERNLMAGNRYSDQMKARFGVYPADAVTDRAIYLGSKSFTVYNKSVYQTTNNNDSINYDTNNPFTTVGAKYSTPLGVMPLDNGQIVSGFKTTEFGYFFVIGSLVPTPYYSTGTDRHLFDCYMSDWADPILSTVGDQPIYKQELYDNLGGIEGSYGFSFDTFGYTQRYSHWKYIDDQVHGSLRDGGNLAAFALQRTFVELPELSTSFIQIPTHYLDQVSAVTQAVSDYGYWADFYNDYKVSMPLPAYSIPTLGSPMDTHTEVIPLGGTRL